MYERMLDQGNEPTVEEMTAYCGECGERFRLLHEWLSGTYGTEWKVAFPYGKHYGWGIAHRRKQKLLCNIFAEDQAFTVMVRLSGKQFDSVYGQVGEYTRGYIDDKYPCGDGGWIHYRVTCEEHLEDIRNILTVKCS